jgi:transposase-like protein
VCSISTFTPQLEDLLHERGIDNSHETVRFWWNRFGPIFAAEMRKWRSWYIYDIASLAQ